MGYISSLVNVVNVKSIFYWYQICKDNSVLLRVIGNGIFG